MRVSELMTREVVTVHPEMPLREAAALLADRRISGAPVVDETGRVVGVLSEADIVAKAGGPKRGHRVLGWLLESDLDLEDKIAARTVGEAMSTPPITIQPQQRVHEAARLMASESINRLPVVSDEGKLVGIVTRADVVRAFARSDAEIAREIEEEILRRTLWLEPGSVTVSVADGVVTLQGQVESEADAELLPVFVSRVPGVVEVRADVRPRVTTPAP